MPEPSWTKAELFAILDAWPIPAGFHIEVDRCRVTGRVFVRVFNGHGCAVTVAVGAESLDHLAIDLDRCVHSLHTDHMFCAGDCADWNLTACGNTFAFYMNAYARDLRNSLIRRRFAPRHDRERSAEPLNW